MKKKVVLIIILTIIIIAVAFVLINKILLNSNEKEVFEVLRNLD